MATQVNRKKQAVWQDITPAKPSLKISPKKVNKISVIIIGIKLLFVKLVIKRLPKNRRKAIRLSILVILVLAILIIGAFYTIRTKQNIATQATDGPTPTSTQKASQPPGLIKGTPTYPVLLPANKNINTSDGWVRPGDKSVFVYIDTINKVTISVSEQPLPDDFKTDTSQQMDSFAKAEKANEKITVGATTVYIGRSANGPQSVFFTKNNLLILIKSGDVITNDQWAAYVNSLQ
jgi:cytoskeletal protein RodZ